MKKLLLETTQPYQGLPELVAYNEGIFEAEGLAVEFVKRDSPPPSDDTDIPRPTSPEGLRPFFNATQGGHGSNLEGLQTERASLYNACEWGNYYRVQESSVGARQLGRRTIITYGALIVPPWSPVYTPQQLADKVIGLPYFNGTHYLALLMVEGFVPRALIKTCSSQRPGPVDPRGYGGGRYRSLMAGEFDATTVVEPFITVAEKAGCRIIALAPYHGTVVAASDVDGDTYTAFNRALSEAVRRINADKRKYMQYFIDYDKADPEVACLTVDDFNLSRLQVVDPAPIPADELERTRQWMVSWDLLDEGFGVERLVDAQPESEAHQLTEA